MYRFTVLDAHCDTISDINLRTNLKESKGHLDIERMNQYEGWIQFFALWIDPKYHPNQTMARFDQLLERYHREMDANADTIEKATNYRQMKAVLSRGKNAAILSLEGAEVIGEHLSGVDLLYHKGVRCVALTWNHTNQMASGAGDKTPQYGLTPFGKQVVERLNRLGMMVDVSHLSDKAFYDVAQVCKGPFVATHSNARAICSHARNLTDEQFLLLKKSGGVTGINLYPLFLSNKGRAGLGDIVAHIEHFCALGGQNHIGLGADFDGIDSTPDGINGIEDIHLIFEELLRLNYDEGLVRKIASGNFTRVVSNSMN